MWLWKRLVGKTSMGQQWLANRLGDNNGHVVGCAVVVPSDLQSQERLLVLKFLLLP